MTNMVRGTSLTGCWLKQASGQEIGQTNQQWPAQHIAEAAPDNLGVLPLIPFEMMRIQMEAIVLREFETACGIFNKHAKGLDDAYLGHVEKFEGTVRNTMRKAIKKFKDEASC